MCFSAGASFGASAVLSIIGTAAIMKARTVPQGLFASIPLIFSIQQLAEGMLWLCLRDPQLTGWQPFFTDLYLVFGLVVWPLWVPFTIRLLETDQKRKKILLLFLIAGFLAAAGAGYAMIFYSVDVIRADHHLHYEISFLPATKEFVKLFTLFYLAATIVSSFISSVKRMKWLGIVFLFSYCVTVILYSSTVVSIWCYFASLLSVIVFWIISGLQEPGAGNNKH